MKKLVVFLFVFMSSLSVFAQNIGVGLRVGANFAKWSGAGIGSTDFAGLGIEGGLKSSTGLTFSVPIAIEVTNRFTVQPELTYIQKGFGFDLTFGGEKVSSAFKLNYVEVPILLKFDVIGTGPVALNIMAGPSLGFLTAGKVVASLNGQSNSEKIPLESLNRFELGLQGGLSLGIKLNNGQIFVDGRYLFGISKLGKDAPSEDQLANRGINIGLGYIHFFR